jgi:hypothetical protein
VVTDGQANLVDVGKTRLKSASDGNNAPNSGSGDRPRRKRSQSS